MTLEHELPYFPYLVYRDEKAIKSDLDLIANAHAKNADCLSRLINSLSAWERQELDINAVFAFVFLDRKKQIERLLKVYGEQQGVNKALKIEKYMEIFDVPDYSGILSDADNLSKNTLEYLNNYYDAGKKKVLIPEIPDTEKAGIIERHSVYITDLEHHKLYEALTGFCKYVNYVNLELEPFLTGNILPHIKTKDSIPAAFSEYFKFKPVDAEGRKTTLEINFPALKRVQLVEA